VIERRRSETDRRAYGLYLTSAGEHLMKNLGRVARQHDDELLDGLDADQRHHLHQMLATIAERQGLTPGVHPGYRTI